MIRYSIVQFLLLLIYKSQRKISRKRIKKLPGERPSVTRDRLLSPDCSKTAKQSIRMDWSRRSLLFIIAGH